MVPAVDSSRQRVRFPAKKEQLTSFSGLFREQWLKSRPESGLGFLDYAEFARQRYQGGF